MTSTQHERFLLILDFENFCIDKKYHLVKFKQQIRYYSFNDNQFFTANEVYNQFIAIQKK